VRVLVAEDERKLAKLLRKALEEQRHSVMVAEDGKEALDLALSYPFDVLLLDVMLPEIDGFEVARKLRTENRRVPILFLTAAMRKPIWFGPGPRRRRLLDQAFLVRRVVRTLALARAQGTSVNAAGVARLRAGPESGHAHRIPRRPPHQLDSDGITSYWNFSCDMWIESLFARSSSSGLGLGATVERTLLMHLSRP